MSEFTFQANILKFSLYRKFLQNLNKEQRTALREGSISIKNRVIAQVEEGAARNALKRRDTYGKTALLCIWNIAKHGWHKLYLGEYDSLTEWAENRLLYDDDGTPLVSNKHLQSMVRIVERILLPVYQANSLGKPFIHPQTGEVITPEFLIGEPNIQEKMRLVSYDFNNAESHEEKQEVLDRVFTETKLEIENSVKERERQSKLFQWWRSDNGDEMVTYKLMVPRAHVPIIDSLLRRDGEQIFEGDLWETLPHVHSM